MMFSTFSSSGIWGPSAFNVITTSPSVSMRSLGPWQTFLLCYSNSGNLFLDSISISHLHYEFICYRSKTQKGRGGHDLDTPPPYQGYHPSTSLSGGCTNLVYQSLTLYLPYFLFPPVFLPFLGQCPPTIPTKILH